MIEFKGMISGNAEKYFFKRTRNLAIKILLVSEILVLFPFALYMIRTVNWVGLAAIGIAFCCVPLLACIPKSKKEKKMLLPKRIYTDNESIICVGEKYVESKLIGDESLVRDFGEFYEIVYPFGKVSDKFICQKNLLSEGTIEEFESLFDGKIERR